MLDHLDHVDKVKSARNDVWFGRLNRFKVINMIMLLKGSRLESVNRHRFRRSMEILVNTDHAAWVLAASSSRTGGSSWRLALGAISRPRGLPSSLHLLSRRGEICRRSGPSGKTGEAAVDGNYETVVDPGSVLDRQATESGGVTPRGSRGSTTSL